MVKNSLYIVFKINSQNQLRSRFGLRSRKKDRESNQKQDRERDNRKDVANERGCVDSLKPEREREEDRVKSADEQVTNDAHQE